MINEKYLDGIEPYNELFFINCFYNSEFSILKYFRKSINPFIANNIATYYMDNSSLSMYYISAISNEELLKNNGIALKYKNKSSNIVEDIVSAIDNDRPVIICVDCFYMTIRQEYYLKNHWPHTILIYGYNQTYNRFRIIEQRHNDSLTYYKTEIGFSDIVNAYNGYFEIIDNDTTIITYYEYALKNSNVYNASNEDLFSTYIRNFNSHLKSINEGMNILKKFTKEYKLMLLNEMALKKNMHNLLNGFNKIINAKKIERFIIQQYSGKDNLMKLIEEIESSWGFIRSKHAKFVYSSIYKPSDYDIIAFKLDNILKNEIQYLNSLLFHS